MSRLEYLISKQLDDNISAGEKEELTSLLERDPEAGMLCDEYSALEQKGKDYYNSIITELPPLKLKDEVTGKPGAHLNNLLNAGYIKAAAVFLLFLLALISFNRADRYREGINRKIDRLIIQADNAIPGISGYSNKNNELKELLSVSLK